MLLIEVMEVTKLAFVLSHPSSPRQVFLMGFFASETHSEDLDFPKVLLNRFILIREVQFGNVCLKFVV
jgi:hypothetical protein